MADARSLHPNAPLTVEGRRRVVRCVIDAGWSVTATTELFQVDAKTMRRWWDRWGPDHIAHEVDLAASTVTPRVSPTNTVASKPVQSTQCENASA